MIDLEHGVSSAHWQHADRPRRIANYRCAVGPVIAALGAAWTGGIEQSPPEGMDAIIDTTPVWGPISEALKRLKPGGRLVINAIRKEEVDKQVLLSLDYPSQLWVEKEIKSVANVTRADVREFLQLAAEADIKPDFQEFELEDTSRALFEMKQGKIRGAKVLRI